MGGALFTVAPRSTRAERSTAGVVLFVLGLRLEVHSGVTVGSGIALILAVIWVPFLRRYRGATTLLALGLAVIAVGLVLPDLASVDRAVNSTARLGVTALLLGLLAQVGVILWIRTIMPASVIGLLFGCGSLVHSVVLSSGGSNPWKNNFAVPTAIVSLSLVMLFQQHRGHSGAFSGGAVLLVLGTVSGLNDSRSYAASFVLAALFTVWQGRPTNMSRSVSTVSAMVLFAALAGTSYWLGTKLLVAGYLGASAQARSIAQIDQSGSLILGGRPELEATLALMRAHPAGFGIGVVPTENDIEIAKTGLSSINYNPNNGYVEHYMFGGHIELHSIVGDLWAIGGPTALALVLAFALHVLKALANSFTDRHANPLLMFLCVWTSWNFLFSPLYSSLPTLVLALGLGIRGIGRPTTSPEGPLTWRRDKIVAERTRAAI